MTDAGGELIARAPLVPLRRGAARRPVDAHGGQHRASGSTDGPPGAATWPSPLPLCYLNGVYLPLRTPASPRLDRGFLYAGRRLRGDAGVRRAPVPLRRARRRASGAASPASAMEDPHARGVARHPGHAHRAQRVRRPVRLLAGDARGGVRSQPRAAAESPAHGVRLLRALSAAPAGGAGIRARLRHGTRIRAGHAAISSRPRCSPNVLLRQLAVDAPPARPSCCARELTEASAVRGAWCSAQEVLVPPNSRRIISGTTRVGGGGDGGARQRDPAGSCR